MTRHALHAFHALVGLAVAAAACVPSSGVSPSQVARVRVLAIVAEPPEVPPGGVSRVRALVVDALGTIDGGATWGVCTAPKPLAENNVVDGACLGDDAFVPAPSDASGATITAPRETCALFGPDAPPGGLRPRDADDTGGYFQPVRVTALGETAFGLLRVRCNLPNTPVAVARDFRERYVPNANPRLSPLHARVGAAAVALDALPAGAPVAFEIGWPAEDAESYLALDAATGALVTRREALRVSWFSNGGVFASDRTGRDEQDAASTTDNTWTSPETPGSFVVWTVLRDARGGAAFAEFAIVTR